MNTKAIHFTAFGNAAIVQVSSEPLSSFPFLPAGPAIRNGDLIAITTAIKGLDVSHAGLAIFQKRTLHLLHASQTARKVVITEDTLYRYLQRRQSRLGIIVARLL